MKELVRDALRWLGYEIRRADFVGDALLAQRQLIEASEPVIFDVGAHLGSVTARYRQLFPFAWIHAFEAHPQSFAKLQEGTREDLRTRCHQLAIAATTGKGLLNVNRSSLTHSLLPSDVAGYAFWGSGTLETVSAVEVDTITIDAFCREQGIPRIDLLKLDVQGAEFDVLVGARGMLEGQSISALYTEVILAPTYRGQRKLHDYLALLDSFGYELVDFFEPVRHHHELIQTDALFISSSFKKGSRRFGS